MYGVQGCNQKGSQGTLGPFSKDQLAPFEPQMKWHFIHLESMESCQIEPWLPPLKNLSPDLTAPHFEKSGYASLVVWGNKQMTPWKILKKGDQRGVDTYM